MGKLSTHVLDTVHGCPAQGVRIELYRLGQNGRSLLKTTTTNHDSHCDEPLLQNEALTEGRYELVFYTGEYFAAKGALQSSPPFLDDIPIRFAVADAAQNYHVPLVVTPWTYSTYRGS